MSDEIPKLVEIERFIANPRGKAVYRIVRPFVEWLLGVDELNRIDRELRKEREPGSKDSTFFDAALAKLGVRYEITDEDRAKIPSEG